MRILALETSGFSGSVAALEAEAVLAELQLPDASRSAQALAPAMQAVLTQAGWRPRDVQLVAVTAGPGSFTGLRVGITTAKTFAYASGADVLGVDTLAAIAHALPAGPGRLHVVIDAHRKELFAGSFTHDRGAWRAVEASHLVAEDAWLARLAPDEIVCGPALTRIREKLPKEMNVAPPELWLPRAAAVGRVAQQLYAAGVRHDLWRLAPVYLRPSAAEERKPG